MTNGYCCGFVPGTNKHQLWCAQHPDRVKETAKEAEPAPPPVPNKPEPKSAADRIAQQCANLLDEDIWDALDKYWITIKGVKLWVANTAGDVRIDVKATAPQLAEVYPAPDFRHIFWDSYSSFLYRERERRAAAVEREMQAKLAPPPPEPPTERKSIIERIMLWLGGNA